MQDDDAITEESVGHNYLKVGEPVRYYATPENTDNKISTAITFNYCVVLTPKDSTERKAMAEAYAKGLTAQNLTGTNAQISSQPHTASMFTMKSVGNGAWNWVFAPDAELGGTQDAQNAVANETNSTRVLQQTFGSFSNSAYNNLTPLEDDEYWIACYNSPSISKTRSATVIATETKSNLAVDTNYNANFLNNMIGYDQSKDPLMTPSLFIVKKKDLRRYTYHPSSGEERATAVNAWKGSLQKCGLFPVLETCDQATGAALTGCKNTYYCNEELSAQNWETIHKSTHDMGEAYKSYVASNAYVS